MRIAEFRQARALGVTRDAALQNYFAHRIGGAAGRSHSGSYG
jgi:hypothetical protein